MPMQLAMRLRVLLVASSLAVLFGCAQVSVRDERGARTGFVYYDPMPCLLVKRHADTGEVLDATVLTLPNRSRPHYVVHRPGLGVATFAAETENGVLTKFTHGAEAQAEEPLKAVSEGFKGIAEELLRVEKGRKALEAEVAERAADRAAAAAANEELDELERRLPPAERQLREEARRQGKSADPIQDLKEKLGHLRKCVSEGKRPSDCGLAEFIRMLQQFDAMWCQPAPPATQKELKAWCDAVDKAIRALAALCAPVSGDGSDGRVPFKYELYEVHVQDGHVTGLSPLPMDVIDASLLSGGSVLAAPTGPCGGLPPPAVQAPPRRAPP